jgi:tetratricopeptide (TPR) repeat protein
VPAPDLSPKPPTETLSICEVDDLYLISESCFDIISRMKVAPAEISDFFSLCQDAHKGNETLLAIIREFQERYSVDRAISLLNRDPFFYGYLDNLFKFAYVGGMIPCRVFIHDIQKQLEKHKCTSTVQVYQCELMTNEKFQKWKTFNGKIIAVKSFFLANSNRETITSYMADYGPSDAAHKRILFIIEANPQIKNVKLFAKIGSLSDYNDPNDVMFAIGSLFKITEIQDEKDGIINIKMSLCANDVNDSTVFMDYLKGQYIDLNGETDDIGFGRFLFDMGSQINRKDIFDTGEELIRSSLQKLTNDHPDLYRYYDALGDIDLSKSKLDSSLDCYQQSLKIKETKLQKNDLSFVDSYKNMALVYHQKKELKKAFEYFEELLKLWKILYGDEYASLPFCYTHMASIHEAEGRLPQAVSCYYQALSLMVKYCPESNLRLADVYHGLGRIHLSTERYHLASGYYHEALAIRLKSLPPQNPCIALTYKEIGLVYREMKSIQQSRENLDKAAAIYRQIHPSGDPLVTEIEDLIKNLPT